MTQNTRYGACPSVTEIMHLRVPTMHYVPNSVRPSVTDLLHSLFHRYNIASSETAKLQSLQAIFAVPKLVLRKNGRGETRNRNRATLHRAVRRRITLALRGEWLKLYDEATEAHLPSRVASTPHQATDIPLKRCRLAVQQGALSKACVALMQDDPLAVPNETNAQKMRDLHPQPSVPASPQPAERLPTAFTFSTAEVVSALKTYPFATSPGKDGLRSAMLKTLTFHSDNEIQDDSAITEFTKFMNKAVKGELPQTAHSAVAGGLLLGIPKPDSDDFRPIAIASLLRRFISRLLAFRMSKDPTLQAYLRPLQLCVGVSGACETIVHATRHVCNTLRDQDYVLLQIDASNAFNNINRQAILDEVDKHAPGIARWVHYVYGKEAPLSFGEYIIFSKTGSHQGDPLSLLLFSLALHPLLQQVQQRFGLRFIVFYADDGTIIVLRAHAGEVLNFFETNGEERGFIINRVKTKLWWFQRLTNVPGFNATISTARAAKVLGSPVGTDEGSRRIIVRRRQDQEKLLAAITAVPDPQLAFHLLRYCASSCRLVYLLRTAPPHITYAEAEHFDHEQRRAFEEIHRAMSDSAWQCAIFPFKYGGLGLTKTTSLVEAAYSGSIFNGWSLFHTLTDDVLSSIHTTNTIQHSLQPVISALRSRYSLDRQYDLPSLVPRANLKGFITHLQDEVTDLVQGRIADNYMPSSTDNSEHSRLVRARCLSGSMSEVIRIFSAVPSQSTETQIAPHIWRTLVDMRLGNNVFNGTDPCPECRSNMSVLTPAAQSSSLSTALPIAPQHLQIPTLDSHGYHAAVCKYAMGATRRHNRLRNLVNVLLRAPALGLLPQLEWTFPRQQALPWNTRKRLDIVVDDIAFAERTQGYDVTVVSPHSSRYLKAAATQAAGAARKAEETKLAKYRELCARDRVDLNPIAMDIHGGLGPLSRRGLHRIADFAASRKGTSPNVEYARFTSHVISKSLQLTAAAVNRRMRPSVSISELMDCTY